MKRTPLAGLLAALFATGLAQAAQPGAATRSTYIVRLQEAPVASYRGPQGDAVQQAQGLKATSPAATGARHLDLAAADVRAYRRYLRDRREALVAHAADRLGRTLATGRVYEIALNGLTLELSADEAARLARLPGVAAVEPEQVLHPHTDVGPGWVGADALWNATDGLATRGEGVVVGIIDTGINATHPAFAARGPVDGYQHANPRGQRYGLCAGAGGACNDKLIGIYDFTVCTGVHAGNGCDDREPNTGADVDGHGSHVASTAAGNSLSATLTLSTGNVARSLSGVAPHANLIMYKACEEEESCRLSWLLAAIDQAAADGVDVLNYSIGGTASVSPWQDSDALAMLAARDAGVLSVVSAGNDGPDPGTVESPADAPWVLAAANASHGRVVANRLLDFSGGDTPAPGDGVLVGAGDTAGYGPVDLVVPTDAPLCGTGSDLDSPPTGASNPWAPGRFHGEIVVCLRGTQARVAKSNNVRLAGGGGMVLVNQPADGESVVADQHSIPSTHLGASDGAALLQWLASGSGHRARLEGSQLRIDSAFGDRLNASSSRGPVGWGNYLKPDLTAPGTDILAAAGSGNGFRFLTGTSMAAPHITGAAALLRARHPQWSVSDLQTALRTSAQPVVVDNGTAATAFEQGSGRLDVAQADRMGLGFEMSGSQFRAINPANGGDPGALNLPSLVDLDCFEQCRFERVLGDRRGGGRWRVELDPAPGMQLSADLDDFTLAAGASRPLNVLVDVSAPALTGRTLEGEVRLVPLQADGSVDASVATARLPLAVHASPGPLPASIDALVERDRGHVDVALSGLAALQDLAVATTELVAPQIQQAMLAADPTPEQRYDGFATGILLGSIAIPAAVDARHFRLQVHAESSTAVDIDLAVGLDANGNGLPDEDEELCLSASASAVENCDVDVAAGGAPQQAWVLVQNWQASAGGSDRVQLETVRLDQSAANGPSLVATGPATVPRLQPFQLRLGYDDASFAVGETRYGELVLQANGNVEPLARIPIRLTRGAGANAERLLAPGDALQIRLDGGQASDRIAIDVPANASRLRVQTTGSGEVDLYLARAEAGAGSIAVLDAAPARSAAQASSRNVGADEAIVLEPAQGLRAGRWYVTPVNTAGTPAEFTLMASYETAGVPEAPAAGAWYNPARDGAGLFLYPGGTTLGLLWYTYLEDGTPTWYSASVPISEDTAWQAPLYRSRWNGSSAALTAVGSVLLTRGDSDHLQFGWNLDGRSGSEAYVRIDGGGCARQGGAAVDINGFWYNPAAPGYGYSVTAYPGVETSGAYFYDGNGLPRWALGSMPFGESALSYDLRLGACPWCDYSAPERIEGIGSLVRQYDSIRSGQMRIDVALPAPIAGSWQLDTPVAKLTGDTGCQ